jgi:hypothetical protein
VDDVLAVVGAVGVGIGAAGAEDPNDRSAGASGDELATLDPLAQRVLDGLPGRAWARPDAIAVRSAVPVREVLQALPMLELAGLVEAHEDSYRLAPRVRAAVRASGGGPGRGAPAPGGPARGGAARGGAACGDRSADARATAAWRLA